MLHPYMTIYLIKILNSFLVPSQYISVNYAEQHNTLMVIVYKPNSKDFYSVEFNPAEVSFGDKDVQNMLYQAALWYHDGSIPEIKPSLSQRIISLPRRIIEGIVNQYRLYPVHVTILLLIQFVAMFRIIQILWTGKV